MILKSRFAVLAVLAVSCLAPSSGLAGEGERVIVAFGDSLTAGHGLAAHEAYPAWLEERLRREGYRYRVVNAGVSGDTTADGLERVDSALRYRPDVAIVALGANDGLRGLRVPVMEENLERIVQRFRAAGARVLLAGMRVPPNYGESYVREFAQAFPAVARRTGATLMPFLLDGVGGNLRLNQEDGIHPTVEGQRIMADRLWPYLKPLLRKRSRGGGSTRDPGKRSIPAAAPATIGAPESG